MPSNMGPSTELLPHYLQYPNPKPGVKGPPYWDLLYWNKATMLIAGAVLPFGQGIAVIFVLTTKAERPELAAGNVKHAVRPSLPALFRCKVDAPGCKPRSALHSRSQTNRSI